MKQKVGFGGDFITNKQSRKEQISLIKKAIDLGVVLFDTAEAYSEGRSEEVIGSALMGHRQKAFVCTKFSPENSTYSGIIRSCEASLKRLKTDYIDLYQVHWPSNNSEYDIVKAFDRLISDGKVLNVGVCNYSTQRMLTLEELLINNKIFSNQFEYNYFDRFAERSILPHCHENGMFLIAYSPLNKCRKILDNKNIISLAKKYDKKISQILLNWLIDKKNIIVIPKTTKEENLIANFSSGTFSMEREDYEFLNSRHYKTSYVLPRHISVSKTGEGNRKVYQTLEEAIENNLGFCPSPFELSQEVKQNDEVKPVRLIKEANQTYSLVEGRVRFWAWVLAYGDNKPIPSLIY